ncbi:MAG: hypothetical protein N3G77_03200 [Nitrososphaeria archaeon]|nr:hypothetical protein [Nitrososphaeria archaeon]MDW7986042.1 hypothetical protein [Nitrososphaerota archaeon]
MRKPVANPISGRGYPLTSNPKQVMEGTIVKEKSIIEEYFEIAKDMRENSPINVK